MTPTLTDLIALVPGDAWKLSYHYGKYELLLGNLISGEGPTPEAAISAALSKLKGSEK